jgi:hypothetical protein
MLPPLESSNTKSVLGRICASVFGFPPTPSLFPLSLDIFNVNLFDLNIPCVSVQHMHLHIDNANAIPHFLAPFISYSFSI